MLAAAIARELTWGLPAASREIAHWRRLAAQIPSTPLREDALDALEQKRGQSDGAALFSILPRTRNRSYLQFLVAYQVIWDYLDSVSERGACAGLANGRQLHLALVDALNPSSPTRDYYRHSPWREDGYLSALVARCRECCTRLPSFERVRPTVLRDAERAEVLALNHETDVHRRDAELRAWVACEFPHGHEAQWYELTGAASAGLATFALMALACEPSCGDADIQSTHAAYFPWVAAVACMLDSYADQAEDAASGDHSYISHYPTPDHAIAATCEMVGRCLHELRAVKNSEAHTLIACSMFAMYLSKATPQTTAARSTSSEISRAGGSLTRVLLPLLRMWRAAHGLHSSLNPHPKEVTMSARPGSSLLMRLKQDLPPSPPHPAIVQTLAGRCSPYAYVEHCQALCGDRFTLYPLNMPPHVFFADPADIHGILTGAATELHPGAAGSLVRPVVGERSFMLLEEDAHLWGRRAIAPSLHRCMLDRQAAVVGDAVARSVPAWPQRTPVALDPYVRSLALDVILRVVTGDDHATTRALHEKLTPMLTITDSLLLQGPALRHIAGWRGTWRRFLRQRADVDEILHRLIRERSASADSKQSNDLLELLLAAENPDGSRMSEQQVRDNLMSVILAGYETTSGQVGWAFQLLAHNPHVQSQLIEELDGSSAEDYLRATVYETMRHKPVFLFASPREVAAQVQFGDATYRAPVRLAACTYLMHHNPDLFPEPHTFRPERFLGTQDRSRSWLPWGGGRKHCPGRHLAMLEVSTILREVLSNSVIRSASDRIERPRWRSAILVPHDGGRVILEPRRPSRRNFF